MRCIILLSFLLCALISNSQVVDYWYTQKTIPTSWPVNKILLDASGSPIVGVRSERLLTTNDTLFIGYPEGASTPVTMNGLGGHAIGKETADGWEFENLSDKLEVLNHLPAHTVETEDHFYFIWHSSFSASTITFFGQSVSFARAGQDFTMSIIQTDKNLRVTANIDFNCEIEASEIEMITAGDQGGLLLLWSNRTADKSRRTANLVIPGLSGTFSYNVLEFDASLKPVANTVYDEKATPPFYDGFGRRTLQAAPNHFGAGLHFYNTDSLGDFYNKYKLNETLEGKGTQTLSEHTTNLKISTLANKGDNVYFLGDCPYQDTLVYFDNDTLLYDENYRGNALFLSRLNRDGSYTRLSTIRNLVNYQNPQILIHGNRIWLKVHALNTFYLEQFPAFKVNEFDEIVYLVYDLDGNLITAQEGPGSLRSHWHSDFTTDGTHVYDANIYSQTFRVERQRIIPSYGNFHVTGVVYTKTHMVFPPEEELKLELTPDGCSAFKVRYRATDAEHYTVVISDSKSPNLPIDFENYNYSPDFLKAPSLGTGTRILYQGPDTAFRIWNLPVGRRYTVAVVPGNGPSGATVYNRNATDTASVFLAPSAWQASIGMSPDKDSAVCPGDSFYFTALCPWPHRWSDGLPEASRLLQSENDYYYTTTAPDSCVLSSDTLRYAFLEPATVANLGPMGPPPFCKGDTVWLSAQASHEYLWKHGDSTAQIPITEDGTYVLSSVSNDGCTASDSIAIGFANPPELRFLDDSILVWPEQFEVNYRSNADSFSWSYNGDTAADYRDLDVQSRAFLKLQAFNDNGCSVTDSVLLRFYKVQDWIFPNAFSPNGDGVNDQWYFIHPDTLGELTIYNRWGAVVHTGLRPWDGTRLGERLPLGSYEYVFWYNNAGTRERLEGTIYLLR